MKKFLAIALAAILAATAAYTAIAADEDPESENVVVAAEEEDTNTPSGSLSDLEAALKGDDQAQQIANDLQQAVKDGATQEDVNAFLMTFADYVNNKGFDVGDLKNKEKAKKFVGAFLEDCGVDSKALGSAINGIDEINDQLFGSNTGSGSGSVVSDGDYSYTSYVDSGINYGVESTTIPDTGIVD